MAIRKAQIVRLAVFLSLTAVLQGAAATSQTPSALGQGRANTWAARSSTGVTMGGTWTVIEHQRDGAVTGAWTLLDAQGRTLASGGWSAAKSTAGWTGRWRAAAAGQRGDYTGTWTAKVDLKPAGGFADLFAKAVEAAVSGTWRSGPRSGAWTIQVSRPEPPTR
jgi:hypothetical protein